MHCAKRLTHRSHVKCIQRVACGRERSGKRKPKTQGSCPLLSPPGVWGAHICREMGLQEACRGPRIWSSATASETVMGSCRALVPDNASLYGVWMQEMWLPLEPFPHTQGRFPGVAGQGLRGPGFQTSEKSRSTSFKQCPLGPSASPEAGGEYHNPPRAGTEWEPMFEHPWVLYTHHLAWFLSCSVSPGLLQQLLTVFFSLAHSFKSLLYRSVTGSVNTNM
jgi:hypothetical protein